MIRRLASLLLLALSLCLPVIAQAQGTPEPVTEAQPAIAHLEFTVSDQRIDATAFAITNSRLVTTASTILAFRALEEAQGSTGTATLIEGDGRRSTIVEITLIDSFDLATLRIATNHLTPLTLQPEKLRFRAPVWSYSTSQNTPSPTRTTGTLEAYFEHRSADPRFAPAPAFRLAEITPSPGSPILNTCGHAAGLTLPSADPNIAFALSGLALIDALRDGDPAARFEVAQSCDAAPFPLWIYITGAAGLVALLSALFLIRRPATPSATIPRPMPNSQTLRLMGATRDFTVQAAFPGDSNILQIGSSDDPSNGNHLVLNFPKISRRHAQIEHLGTTLLITDLGSSNGTLIDGTPVPANQTLPLPEGATLTLADIPVKVILS